MFSEEYSILKEAGYPHQELKKKKKNTLEEVKK